jgi:hypothetical protein
MNKSIIIATLIVKGLGRLRVPKNKINRAMASVLGFHLPKKIKFKDVI